MAGSCALEDLGENQSLGLGGYGSFSDNCSGMPKYRICQIFDFWATPKFVIPYPYPDSWLNWKQRRHKSLQNQFGLYPDGRSGIISRRDTSDEVWSGKVWFSSNSVVKHVTYTLVRMVCNYYVCRYCTNFLAYLIHTVLFRMWNHLVMKGSPPNELAWVAPISSFGKRETRQ